MLLNLIEFPRNNHTKLQPLQGQPETKVQVLRLPRLWEQGRWGQDSAVWWVWHGLPYLLPRPTHGHHTWCGWMVSLSQWMPGYGTYIYFVHIQIHVTVKWLKSGLSHLRPRMKSTVFHDTDKNTKWNSGVTQNITWHPHTKKHLKRI